MKTVIRLEKKHVFHHENIAYQKDTIPDRALSLHGVSAVLPVTRDGHLRRKTLVNLESAFARLIIDVVLRLNVMRGSLEKKSCTQ